MNGFDFKIERLRRDLTQWELARLTDISPYRISAIERELIEPQEEEVDRLRRAMDEVQPVHP